MSLMYYCMAINIDQWHVITGLFYDKVYVVISNKKNSYDCNIKVLVFLFFFYSAFVFLIFYRTAIGLECK